MKKTKKQGQEEEEEEEEELYKATYSHSFIQNHLLQERTKLA